MNTIEKRQLILHYPIDVPNGLLVWNPDSNDCKTHGIKKVSLNGQYGLKSKSNVYYLISGKSKERIILNPIENINRPILFGGDVPFEIFAGVYGYDYIYHWVVDMNLRVESFNVNELSWPLMKLMLLMKIDVFGMIKDEIAVTADHFYRNPYIDRHVDEPKGTPIEYVHKFRY